ncbi:MAG: transposase family protein [Carbonactinosporaceae bacterium]
MLVLAWLAKNETFQLAADFDVGVATAWRYCHQALDLLAPYHPDLAAAVRVLTRHGHTILDGTCIGIDRAADLRYYCGKHRRYDVTIQALISPAGRAVWTSPALPGLTHDLTAARAHHIIDTLAAARLATLADKGYRSVPRWRCPRPGRGNARSSPHSSRVAWAAARTAPAKSSPNAPRDWR